MTPLNFDELVGPEVEGAERERLRRVHELLVEAGPPPEMTPELEAGPSLAVTIGSRRRKVKVRRQVMLLAAAVAVLALAFLGGYLTGNGGGTSAERTLQLSGTPAAPHALASLQIEPKDAAGNWPMKLSVEGLPTLPARSYYEVYLVRDGKPWASCGSVRRRTWQAGNDGAAQRALPAAAGRQLGCHAAPRLHRQRARASRPSADLTGEVLRTPTGEVPASRERSRAKPSDALASRRRMGRRPTLRAVFAADGGLAARRRRGRRAACQL